MLEFMSENTDIPILLDGDTGYGNYNNARRLVKKLEQIDVAGVCLEDKLFPKQNSLLDDGRQDLADPYEFGRKLTACKDTAKDPDFVVVARVEAFIAGWGLEEALKRAEIYKEAGADAILMHSKLGDHSEIEAFMKVWNKRHPVVLVPTKYYTTPTSTFRDWGANLVIWANHNLRSSIKAMQETSKAIYEQESLESVEPKVVPVKEVFRLQNQDELKQADKKYL